MTAMLTGAAADITGVTLAATLAVTGLYVIPARRRAAKEEFQKKVGEVRGRLDEALTRQVHSAVQDSQEKVNESIAPYRRFVEVQQRELNEARGELVVAEDALLRLWSRGYPGTHSVVLKATSSSCRIAAGLLERHATARAVYLNLGVEPYLATLLAGQNSGVDLRGHGPVRIRQLQRRIETPLPQLHALSLGELDLPGQQQVEGLTRRLVDRLLVPTWFHTDPVLAHARLFFDEYVPPDAKHRDEKLAGEMKTDDEQLQDYYCYVLLDFVSADSSLDEHPLAAAVLVARELGLEDRFVAIAVKELKLRKKQIEDVQKQAEELVRKAR
jgi:hypothetical protein